MIKRNGIQVTGIKNDTDNIIKVMNRGRQIFPEIEIIPENVSFKITNKNNRLGVKMGVINTNDLSKILTNEGNGNRIDGFGNFLDPNQSVNVTYYMDWAYFVGENPIYNNPIQNIDAGKLWVAYFYSDIDYMDAYFIQWNGEPEIIIPQIESNYDEDVIVNVSSTYPQEFYLLFTQYPIESAATIQAYGKLIYSMGDETFSQFRNIAGQYYQNIKQRHVNRLYIHWYDPRSGETNISSTLWHGSTLLHY